MVIIIELMGYNLEFIRAD